MNAIEVLHGRTVLFAHAHPDDAITQPHLLNGLAEEANPDTLTLQYVATAGEATTVNNYDPRFIVDGGRAHEAQAIGDHFGLKTIQDYYPDGRLHERLDELTERILGIACKIGATAIVSTGGLTDHPDHLAIGKAASAAGERLGVLVLQLYLRESDIPPTEETCGAPATPRSIRYALDGVPLGGSHHQMKRADSIPRIPEGWLTTPDGEFVGSELTIRELEQYPLWRDAGYGLQEY